jgi:hypothetical protein
MYLRRLTLEMSGRRKAAKPPFGCPLDRRVRRRRQHGRKDCLDQGASWPKRADCTKHLVFVFTASPCAKPRTDVPNTHGAYFHSYDLRARTTLPARAAPMRPEAGEDFGGAAALPLHRRMLNAHFTCSVRRAMPRQAALTFVSLPHSAPPNLLSMNFWQITRRVVP